HYHMGGVIADEEMRTGLPGLFVAGEAVGGANGANRLSGNAITEALVFGRLAGRSAAQRAKTLRAHAFRQEAARSALDLLGAVGGGAWRPRSAPPPCTRRRSDPRRQAQGVARQHAGWRPLGNV